MSSTNIEWAEAVWNPVVGCTPVSPGCLNCYAAGEARRWGSLVTKGPRTGQPVHADYAPVDGVRIAEVRAGRPVFTGKVRTLEHRLDVPLKRRTPTRWFVNSMSDLFHEAVPFEFVDRVFAVMALCPQHTFLVLTKRPERMAEYLTRREISRAYTPAVRGGGGGDPESMKWKTPCDRVYTIARELKGREAALELIWPLPNVWLGTSVENQKCADARVRALLACPAAVRFLSCEPLLGAVDLTRHLTTEAQRTQRKAGIQDSTPGTPNPGPGPRLHWIIVGGESGPHARPCNVAWVRSIVEQCKAAGVPCFVKQLGARVTCRNDEVSDWMDQPGGPCLDDLNTQGVVMQGDPVRVLLRDRKGAGPAEWPPDLQVRDLPATSRSEERNP